MILPFTFKQLLLLAGVGHFLLLAASALTPVVLDWRVQLKSLPPLLRQLFWVYGAFIVLTIVGLGTLTLRHAQDVVGGDPVARSLAVFAAVFWGMRLIVQWFVFDTRPYLTNGWLKLGNQVLTLTFLFFTLVYAWAAIRPVP